MPDEERGRSRWLGAGQGLHFELCQAIKRVLMYGGDQRFRSRRAEAALEELRIEFSWIEEDATTLIVDHENSVARWWTFAGHRYNGAAAALLDEQGCGCTFDGFAVTMSPVAEADTLPERLVELAARLAGGGGVVASDDALDGIKFRDCVPSELLEEMVRSRVDPSVEAATVAEKRVLVRRH